MTLETLMRRVTIRISEYSSMCYVYPGMSARDNDRARAIAIKAFVGLDDTIKQAIADCNFDLYYGPNCGTSDEYTGFVSTCDAIAAALSDIGDLFVDDQSDCVTRIEPNYCDGCDDENCEGAYFGDWYRYDRSDVIAILVGRELAPYVR
jgi:hypothetical protein